MENHNNFDDLGFEEMRQQMAELKQQLDNQIHVNEERLKKDVIQNSERINSFGSWMLLGGIAAAILVPTGFYYMYGFSILCCVVTSLLVICDASFDYYNAHRIKKADLTNKNFSEALHTLVSMKKSHRTSFAVGLTCLVPMIFWWGYELYHTPFFDKMSEDAAEFGRWTIIGGGAIGAIIGLIIAIRLYKKQGNNINQLIEMVEQTQE